MKSRARSTTGHLQHTNYVHSVPSTRSHECVDHYPGEGEYIPKRLTRWVGYGLGSARK